MKKQLAMLALHRRKLLKRIETQRTEITVISRHFKKSIVVFDIGLNAANFLSRHPALVAGSFAIAQTLWRKGMIGLNSIIPLPIRFAISAIFSATQLLDNNNDDSDLDS